MNIVLVCIRNFQDYILFNVKQLIKLKHENIFVITESIFFPYFDIFKNQIHLIRVEDLNDSYDFYSKSNLDKYFRNGFWTLTSQRFFYLYEFMRKYNIQDVIHLENDVLLYHHCNEIKPLFNREFLYLPFDTFQRNIASVMYIPNADVFKKILDHYNFTLNDMENFAIIKKQTRLIENLPIFPKLEKETNEEIQFVTSNFELFQMIFDAAAMGQYLGGVDPRNDPGNTVGFINETCIIKYNHYSILWEKKEEINRPYLLVEDQKIPIFNLHIHCKNLEKFM